MFVRIHRSGSSAAQRASESWRALHAQPGWLSRTVALVFVLALPVLLLVSIALLAALAVFAVLWAANGVLRALQPLRPLLPRRDGRENVRVIRRL